MPSDRFSSPANSFTHKHSAGGKRNLPLLNGVRGEARFHGAASEYRTSLERSFRWASCSGEKYWLWIGANPSTAEGNVDDPTIRKEQAFTFRAGIKHYIKCNVLDYRATYPRDLLSVSVPRSAANLQVIEAFARNADRIICCWGVMHKRFWPDICDVKRILKGVGKPVFGFGIVGKGSGFPQPRHPLYVSNKEELRKLDGFL